MFSYLLLGIALIGTLASTVFLALALLAARRHAINMQAARQRLMSLEMVGALS